MDDAEDFGTQKKKVVKAQIISGKFGEIIARERSDAALELGEILVASTTSGKKFFFQVYDIQYSSQISQQNLELISGMHLEEDADFEFMDKNVRNYRLAMLKNLITVTDGVVAMSKDLPGIFTKLYTAEPSDFRFLSAPKNPLFFGNLRSGSSALDFPVYLDGKDVLTHHVLISGTTGKGKSVLMSNILWDCASKNYCALLVLDPHDEYYGRKRFGLKDSAKRPIYYTVKDVPQGARTLKINLKSLRPQHFGCLDFSDAQEQAMNAYYKEFGTRWIENIILDRPLQRSVFIDATIGVLKRRLMYLLDLDFTGEQLFCNGVFDLLAGESTIKNICDDLERCNTVIIDTSSFSGQVELLIGSLITTEAFSRYKNYKITGELLDKPIISIVLEEAPRVLGKDVLEKGSNIFSTIAREGRKFSVGLVAITQLPSLIPREILANINTKIILGIDMINERQAIIDSASQDLSSDSRAIASLDKGECIVSSNFAKFAMPIKIPYFEEWAKRDVKNDSTHADKKVVEFSGVGL